MKEVGNLNKYEFFLEDNGKHMSSQNYKAASDEIVSNSIDKAINKFCSQNKFKLISYDVLDDGSYRVFVDKKVFLKAPVQHIFLIQNSAL